MNQHEPFPTPLLAVLTLFLALATFMQVLDTTIANVSIPTIAGDLGVTPTQGTWVITAFAVSNAIAMPLTGWLAKRFGEVRLFVFSTGLFSLTSMLCGMAPNYQMLIFGRVLQGAVAAPMMPLSQSLLLSNYPKHKKGLALAFWSMTATLGPIAGPLLGGYITDNFDWPWIFYINVPIGLLSAFIVWEMLKDRETDVAKFPIDYIGLALLIVGVGSLQIMLDKGNELDWFSSPTIIILCIITVISISFFIVWELFNKHPVIDLSLFTSRNFTIGAISLSLGYTIFLGGGVVFPLWLQTELGYTAFWAGFASATVGIFAFLLSPLVGSNMHRLNLRVLITFSFILFGISYYWMANFTTEIDLFHASVPRLLMGAAMSMFFVPLTAIILSELDEAHTASAMGLVNFLRILGGGLGTSIAVTLWERWGHYHHAIISEQVTMFSHTAQTAVSSLHHAALPALPIIDQLITQQAMTRSNDDILLLSSYAFAGLIILIWMAKPPFMSHHAK
ncbi:DHA2 family efflux MFS transporter permease subunit [Sulfurospirillum sp. 1612]|uniref:DHA2 family efflux MFS transporter permease subunit n=1 Tax=Sulfurospirillum sp. 1612 TaxID=3094835 RepID=UPI002F94BE10